MKEIMIYQCEKCDSRHTTKEACEKCEASHLVPVKHGAVRIAARYVDEFPTAIEVRFTNGSSAYYMLHSAGSKGAGG
jgi:Primosomal protein N'' (replication factor Y) - superfamily II helicase